jgi:hypothetical protein
MTKPPNKTLPSWDELSSDEKPAGMSPDMAKKLLAMNPALRQQGFSTEGIVAQKPVRQTPKASASAAVGFDALVVAASGELAEERKLIAKEIEALERRGAEAKARALDRIGAWLLSNDPNMLSPVTQAAFNKHKPLLDSLGFSLPAFLEARAKGVKK